MRAYSRPPRAEYPAGNRPGKQIGSQLLAGPAPAARRSASVGAPWRLASRRPIGAEKQWVMMIERRRQVEQRLEQAVDVGRGIEIAAAHHVGDALGGIVDGDGEMIAGRRVLAGEHDVAIGVRLGLDLGVAVVPVKRPGRGGRLRHVETPGMRLGGRRRSRCSARQARGRCRDRAGRPGHAGARRSLRSRRRWRSGCRSRDRRDPCPASRSSASA